MPTDQAMLNEAISAAQEGDKVRARDLLTRLLRIDKDYPDHWLWMSAVVESRQEQIYCLQNLLRVDPQNVIARRGLIMMGALEAEPGEVAPVPPQRGQPWSVEALQIEQARGLRALMANPSFRLVAYIGAGLLTLGLLAAGAVGISISLPDPPTPDFRATAAAVGQVITLTPTSTDTPTATPVFITSTPTPAEPTPLVFFLEATYTPTPLYFNTPHPEAEAYRLGLRARERGDWAAVVELMQQTADLVPGAADVYFFIGEAYLNQGEYGLALAAFSQAIQTDDGFGPGFYGRALARLAIDPEADVIDDLDAAISRAGDFGEAYLERARQRVQSGDNAGAEADLAAAEILRPGAPLIPFLRALSAYNEGRYPEALTQITLAHEADFTDLPTYRLAGEIHLALGDPLEAATWLETYLRYVPDDPAALFTLVEAYVQAEMFDAALEVFTRAEGLVSPGPDFYLRRGLAYLAVNDPESALDDLNQANRLRRNDFEINLALGRALLARGDAGDAYIQFNTTVPFAASDAQTAQLFYYRGLALKAIVDQGDDSSRPAAIRDLENALLLSEHLPPELSQSAQELLDELKGAAGTPAAALP